MGIDRHAKAAELHQRGFNCAQSVLCAFSDVAAEKGIDEEALFRMSESFGLGGGCMKGTCGALAGAMMLAGIVGSDGDLEAPRTKASTYKVAARMRELFEQRAGAYVCAELKGVGTGTVLLSCPGCVSLGVDVALEVLALDE
jgi:C_GCAxxG_C_C family probable redox protein